MLHADRVAPGDREYSMQAHNLLTERQVAERLALSVASLRRWRLLGRPPRWVKLGTAVRYLQEDLDAYVAALPSGGGSPDPAGREVA